MPVEALKNTIGAPEGTGDLRVTRFARRAILRLLSLRTSPRLMRWVKNSLSIDFRPQSYQQNPFGTAYTIFRECSIVDPHTRRNLQKDCWLVRSLAGPHRQIDRQRYRWFRWILKLCTVPDESSASVPLDRDFPFGESAVRYLRKMSDCSRVH